MPKVSIIMPCLNVKKYICECMDSVVNQTLRDMEIYVIDAGSTDGTLEILAEYSKRDGRVHVVHSDKKSYGYQMNLGIDLATGDYIGIVETDDIVETDMFRFLYEEAVREDADYVKGTSEGVYYGTGDIEWRFPIMPCQQLKQMDKYIVVPKDTPSLFVYDNFLWNGIYRRDFLKKVKFNETPGAAFQDIGALFQIISRAEKGVYIKRKVYNYRQDNITASSYNRKSLLYTATEYQFVQQFLPGLSKEWEQAYYVKMAGLTINRFHFMAGSGEFWNESISGIEALHTKLLMAVKKGMINQSNCELWEEIQIFLDEPRDLYIYDRKIFKRKSEKMDHILEVSKRHGTYIFGSGAYGKFVHMYLELHGAENIIAFCDNSKSIQGKVIQTLPVIRPEETIKNGFDAYYIIAAKNHTLEMKKQLIQMGVNPDCIEIYDAGIDIYLLKK